MGSRTEPDDCQPGTPNLLGLPCTLLDGADPSQAQQINALQIEYARDSTLLQSRAYDAILKILRRSYDT